MAEIGISARATAGYRIDAAGQTYTLGEAYPVTRGGVTFGWDANNTANTRDRSATGDARLAGVVFTNHITPRTLRIDLPATGTRPIRLALGDAGGGVTNIAKLYDGGVLFATIGPTATAGGRFLDATGVEYLEAAWVTSNTPISHNFTTTLFEITIGDGVSGSISEFAHVSFGDVTGGGGGATVNLAISNLSSAGTLSTVAATVTPAAPNTANLQISNLTSVGTLSTVAATVTPAQGTLTSDVFAAWGSPAPLAALSIPRVVALKMSDGTVALNLANQVTNGAGRIVLVNASLVAGTWYMLGTWNADGSARGLKAYQAT